MKLSTNVFAAALLAAGSLVEGHSNVERLMRIASNGTMIGKEGYPRGFVSRENPAYSDPAVGWLVPPNGRSDGKVIHPDDKLASPPQRTANYTSDLPMLVASPGDLVALQYQENGHVTLPLTQANKPANRGTIYVYGTSDLSPDTNLLDVLYRWSADGKGGNGKGRLLATRNFDDGQCYQVNGGPISQTRVSSFSKTAENPMGQNLWCQSDVSLPEDLAVGKPYTLIWVWDWPTMDRPNVASPPSSAPGARPGPNGEKVQVPEIYTTVMDINIVDPCADELGPVKGFSCNKGGMHNAFKFVKNQDLNLAAVSEQCTKPFLVNNIPGASSPTTSATANISTPAASTPAPTGCGGSGNNTATRVKTETVYSSISTVTVTVTATPGGDSSAQSAGDASFLTTPTSCTHKPTITPFVKASRAAFHRFGAHQGFGH